MCNKCKEKSCGGGCGGNSASSSGNSAEQLANQVAELAAELATLTENAKFLLCGHPILLIEHADDINQFDFSSGLGMDCWDGWAICDGQQHYSKNAKKNITTPNFTDRFIVQAGGNYAVDDTGGLDSVVLVTAELPAHNHGITDPGHIHDINDPGHIHPIQDDMHTHESYSIPHRHSAELAMGPHTHDYRDEFQDDVNIGFVTVTAIGTQGFLNSSTPGEVTVASAAETFETRTTDTGTGGTTSGFTDLESATVEIQPAATGIEVLNSLTGIDETQTNTTGITTNNEGSDVAHENRPPFYASFYIIKL
jgi:microcystin-dependent protein